MATGKKILYIDPVGEKPEVNAAMCQHLNRYRKPGWPEVPVTSLGHAPLALEYYTYLSLIGPDLLRVVKQAEKDGYDAAIIGCFCDPCLDAAKEICNRMVVVGVMEAAVHLASFFAPRFSILVAQQKSVILFRHNLDKYGLASRVASFRSLDFRVEDLLRQPETVRNKMRAEICLAIQEDSAEGIILGCTCQLGHFAHLQKEFHIPIIDAPLAGLLAAEHLLEAHERYGWYTSKINSLQTPPEGELAALGLDKKYGLENLL